MKKINYLVLMAAMMLIGTNSWATTHAVATDAQFETAWRNASSGDVIKLTDAITLTKTMWLGTENMNDASRKIEIDLNGYNLLSSAQYAFLLTHGTLKISNSRPSSGQVQGTYTKYDGKGAFSGNANLFYITGSTNQDDVDPSKDGVDYYTHLEICEDVIVTQAHYDALVTIAEENKGGVAQIKRDAAVPAKPALTYITNVYGSSENGGKAVAHGVRLDLKGTINGTKYGIKTNGNLGSPFDRVKAGTTSVTYAATSTFENVKTYTIENADADRCPYVYIHPKGKITVWDAAPAGTDRNPIGVYASGYARWKVEGHAEGCNGAVIKSGQVDFTDAVVIGTGPVYEEATASNSGTSSSGSGIVIASTDAYAGGIEVSIGGDSEISSQNGYAIEEVITSSDNKTDVEEVSITGGSFEGSADQGTIKITETTTTNETTKVEVTGGQVVGADPEDPDVVSIGGLSLTEFLEEAASEGTQEATHITVTTNEEGEKVMVIVSGETPDAADDYLRDHEGDAVNWKHSSSMDKTPMEEDIVADLKLDQLQMNQDYAQVVTVKTGKKLEVGSVVLGKDAQIIVEPGATFIVTKKDGIYARQTSNIILQTEEGNPSIFLFDPAVTTNAHPSATVEFISKSFTDGGNYTKQRFGIPTNGALTSITTQYDDTDVQTALSKFDYEGNKWVDFGWINVGGKEENLDQMNNSFDYYQMQHNTPNKGTIVTMKGSLVGNDNPTLSVRGNFWNGFANSYMGPIDGAALINMIPETVDKAFYLYDLTQDYATWEPVTLIDIEEVGGIQPMQPFLIRNTKAAAEVKVDYGDAVYYPTTGFKKPNSAPARRSALSNITKAKLTIKGEDCIDRVVVAEGEQFSNEFDNGYDAAKYMNEGINLYVTSSEKMSIFATDNLENTYVGLQTVSGGAYSIEFSKVQGEDLTLIDLETGARVAVNEGNVYTFTANANTTNDYRFQIVRAKKVATDIESVEAQKNAKGIYTIMGQYVGEMNLWNSLPAGVYVVDGKKLVK